MTAGEIREIRSQLGFSQVQLAQVLGVHPLTVSKWERGVLVPTAHQAALMESFGKAAGREREIGEQVAGLLVTAGIAIALYALLEAAFGDRQ